MNERQQSIVKILEKHVADMDNEFDTLDRKAQQNIAVSSIVVAVVGALKLNETLPSAQDDPAFILIFVLYGIAFILSLVALWPQRWLRTPLDPTRENVAKVEGKSDAEYYKWLIDTYLSILSQNKRVLILKSKLVIGAIFVLLLEVAVVGYAALS